MYDGTIVASVSGLKSDTLNAQPPVTLDAVSNVNFDTKHVGTNKSITYDSTFSDTVYALFAPINYATGTYLAGGDITVRPLTVSAVTDERIYDGTTSSVGVPTVTDLQSGDTLNGTLTQNYDSKNVLGTGGSTLVANGPYSVTDGNGGNNYTVAVDTALGTITPAALTITADDAAKVYGETLVLADTAFNPTGLVNGETVGSVTQSSTGTLATAQVADSPYGITPSAASGGTFTPGNYSITYVDGKLYILPVVVPPVDVPSVDVPILDVPPADTPEKQVLPDTPIELPIVKPPVGPAVLPPAVVMPLIPPQLQTLTPPVLLIPVAASIPVAAAPRPQQIEQVAQPEVPRYVAPMRPRKQDRN